MVDYAAEARKAAQEVGHPEPETFHKQMYQESGYRDDVIRCQFVNQAGVLGIAQLHPLYHPRECACDWRCALPYAARLMKNNIESYGSMTMALVVYNWGSGNVFGYTRNDGVRVPPWDKQWESLPGETQGYLSVIVGKDRALRELRGSFDNEFVRIGPDVPDDIIRQFPENWSCAVRASFGAWWVADQLDRGNNVAPFPSYAEYRDKMLGQGLVSRELGLMVGTGGPLAAFLNRETGLRAYNVADVTIERVRDEIRKGNLVLIGGHQWGPLPNPPGHWALAVGVEDDGTLTLENPAGTYPLGPSGTRIGDQLLTSWQHSSWSAVVLELPTVGSPVPEPDDLAVLIAQSPQKVREFIGQLSAEKATLQEQLQRAQTLVGEGYNHDGSVRRAIDEMQNQLQALENFLEDNATKKRP